MIMQSLMTTFRRNLGFSSRLRLKVVSIIYYQNGHIENDLETVTKQKSMVDQHSDIFNISYNVFRITSWH